MLIFAGMESPAPFIDRDLKRLLESSFEDELRRSVQAYIERQGVSPSRFGRVAVGDPNLVTERLKPGKSVVLDTADRVRRFMGELEFRPLLCWELDAFMDVTQVKPWMLGQRALAQSKFVAQVREGGSPRLATVERCRAWMREQVREDELWAIHTAVAVKRSHGAGAHSEPAMLLETFRSQGGQEMKKHPILLNTAQAAAVVDLSPRTLERYRVVGGGPCFRKIGRWVRYTPEDLERWLESRLRVSTSDDGSGLKKKGKK